MITIEVLISLFILFLVVTLSGTAMKHLLIVEKQKSRLEGEYITFHNLQQYLNDEICTQKNNAEGVFLDLSYTYNCTLVHEMRDYYIDTESYEKQGNIGNKLVKLYKVDLTYVQNEFTHSQKYLKTVIERLQ